MGEKTLAEEFAQNIIKSNNADSIYYADLITINQKNWMILGHGKTVAALMAAEKADTSLLAHDMVAI